MDPNTFDCESQVDSWIAFVVTVLSVWYRIGEFPSPVSIAEFLDIRIVQERPRWVTSHSTELRFQGGIWLRRKNSKIFVKIVQFCNCDKLAEVV